MAMGWAMGWPAALVGAGFAAVFACQGACAEPPPAPKPAPPLVGLDGNSQLGTPQLGPSKSTPIADPKGDKDTAGKLKPQDPPHAPVDPKVFR
jgi:hypothetical protein